MEIVYIAASCYDNIKCRSVTSSWFRSKRFRVEGAPSSLFAVLSPVKRAGDGLTLGRRVEEGLPRGIAEEQRPPSSIGEERREKNWERRRKSEERQIERHHGDIHVERHRVKDIQLERHEEMEQERKSYSFPASSLASSYASRQGFFYTLNKASVHPGDGRLHR